MKLFDTDAVVELLRRRKHEVGAVSIITLIEVLRGVKTEKRADVKNLLEESFKVLGLDNNTVKIYCNLHQKLKEEGASIPDADLLIAATAMSQDATLKTGDKHFERLKRLGLKIERTPPF